MFGNLFGRREYPKIEVPTLTTVVVPEPKPEPPEEDVYRVGYHNSDRQVTLTVRTPQTGHSMTLGLSPQECERMIRMLRAAYPVGWEEHEADFNDYEEHHE